MSSIIEDTADSPPDADGWHTDVTWVAEPPAYAVLNAKVIPERGGDTMWSSLFAAYDALSPVMQELCCRLTVRHHSGADFHERVSRTMGEEVADRIMAEFPPVEHPLGPHPPRHRSARAVRVGPVHGPDRRDAPRRERRAARIPRPPHRGPELLRALALDRGRRRGLGRSEHEPPRAVRPLSGAPRDAAVHRRRRTPLLHQDSDEAGD